MHFSQTGQLTRVLDAVLAPLEADPGIEVVHETLKPEPPYPFPWPLGRFFDVFPESVYLDPPPLAPLAFDPEGTYDLVVLGYQPWYLSPAPPMTGFLQSPQARRVLHGRPVVTVVACRNMWLMAQEEVKRMLADVGARLIDNIVLVDQGRPAATFVTTPRWLLTGRKDRFLGLFPEAGVAEAAIHGLSPCGERLRDALKAERLYVPVLADITPTRVDARYIAAERLGRRSFRIWGAILRAAGPQGSWARVPLLGLYALFLGLGILTAVPLSLAVRKLLALSPVYRRGLEARAAPFRAPYG